MIGSLTHEGSLKLKFIKDIVLFVLFFFACFTYFSHIQDAQAAAAQVCFCHNGSTLCTSSSGQINGHFGHGDDPFPC